MKINFPSFLLLKRKNVLIVLMKIFLVICFLTLSGFTSKSVFSQDTNVFIESDKTVPVEEIFDLLKEQTTHTFVYRVDLFDEMPNVDLKQGKTTVGQLLENSVSELGYSIEYKMDGTILIYGTGKTADNDFAKQEQSTISGTVTDPSGIPIPGVNVMEKGTSNGTVTNFNGEYVIDVPPGAVLVFSYIGYETLEIEVANQTQLDVSMETSASGLEEVVVVAMGKQKKVSVVGAISRVDVEEIRDVPTTSVTNALAGKLSGVVSVQRSGEIGRNTAAFWIRGLSTYGSNRGPLVLVDGVERSLNSLSVEEIESVSVLKDAAATAVYGSRAANGVVLVTTRQGAVGKPQIQVDVQHGVTDLPMRPEYLGGARYARLYNEALGRENYSDEYIQRTIDGEDPYLYPDVNWFEEIFTKYAQNTKASINVQGGSETARYFVQAGYYNEIGNLKNDPNSSYESNLNLKRYNFRTNVDIDIFPTTTLNLQVGGYLSDLNTPGLGGNIYGSNFTPAQEAFYWANLSTPLSTPVRVPIGELPDGTPIMGWGAPTQIGEMNPAERVMGSGYDTEYQSQLLSQIVINQDLDAILEGLDGRLSFAFDAYNNTSIQRRKTSSTYGVLGRDESTGELLVTEVGKGNEFLNYSRALGSNRAEELKAQLNYQRELFPRHNFGGMVIYYQRDYRSGNALNSVMSLPERKQGLATRFTYNYDLQYLFEFNLGYNGSENFEKGHRFGIFPAVAAGWVISREAFWKDLEQTINLFKIRGSYGVVGSQALPGGDRFGYITVYGSGLGGYSFGGGSPSYYSGVGLDRAGISDLSWEKGFKTDIGIQMEMFNGAVSLEVDYFQEKRTNILTERISLPAIVGINSVPYANIGEMLNRGVDGTINISKQISEDFSIRLYGNATFAKNKIIEMDEPLRRYPYQQRTGHPLNQNFGLVDLGYFTDSTEIAQSPTQTFGVVRPGDVKYKDINGDGEITVDDQVAIGYSNVPQLNYGFGLHTQYKNFNLGLFFRGQGRVTYTLGGAYIPFNQGVGKGNLYAEAWDRWTVENPNPNAQYPRLFDGTSANNWQPSTRNIYDGSFLRLQTIQLGYSASSNLLQEYIGLDNLGIYLVADNVALFSKWDMWDPETGSRDGSNYPLQRKVNLGIKANF